MPAPLAPIPELIAKIQSDPACAFDRAGRDVTLARAPGRLDIMGGIADYSGSLVCTMPLDLGTAVAMQPRHDRMVVLTSYNIGQGATGDAGHRVEFSLDDFWGTAALLPVETARKLFAGPRRWAAYVAGAYYVLAKHRKLSRRITGANIACYSEVPLGAGLASSAALEIAGLSALTDAYHLLLEPLETAVTAQRVENQIVGAPCGVMDQMTSMLGQAGKQLLLECQPHTVEGYADLPVGVAIAGIDSNVPHSAGADRGRYRNTRIAAFMAQAIIATAYRDFGAKKDPTGGYLANVALTMYRGYLRRMLPQTMTGADFLRKYAGISDRVTTVDPAATYFVRAAGDHHVMEAQRVRAFVAALKKGDRASLVRAGRLMTASHASYGQRVRMGSREADLLVRHVLNMGLSQGFYGARITAGGCGGTVAVLYADGAGMHEKIQRIAADYQKSTGIVPRLFFGSGPGAVDSPAQRVAAAELFQ